MAAEPGIALEARPQKLVRTLTDDLLFCQGETCVYSGEHLGAISLPLGGIGTGSVEIDGRAVRHLWHIFNNMELVCVPNSFFAVRVKSRGGRPVVRALQTVATGPLAPVKSLTFRGEYPFGWYDFDDPDLLARIHLEVFNPLVPLAERDSSIPCAIHNITMENPTDEPLSVSVLATQQNAAGYTGDEAIDGRVFPTYGGNRTRLLRQAGATLLHMTVDRAPEALGYGDMVLAVLDDGATGTASWKDLATLADDFAEDGKLSGPEIAGPTPGGETLDGALAVTADLAPGERRTVTVLLTWHFPNASHGQRRWGGQGNRYAVWWDNALDVARELLVRLDELTGLTRLYHDTFYAGNLPRWLLDRIGSQVVVLRSLTCFWTRSGYFGGWEGCCRDAGCCMGNCSHVWHYAQAHARLFPGLARTLRQQEFAHQTRAGLIPFRQGTFAAAVDGQTATVLNSYREHLCSPDGEWLNEHWTAVRQAMDYTIATWDPDEDGVLSGPQHNTLDAELGGSSSWLGTMYLAALAAAERMAELQGEKDTAARYRRIREMGAATQNETLWNGEYYAQIPEATPQRDYGQGCHIDQVLGQWWAHQLGLGWLYPPDRVRTALRSLFKYNFRDNFRGVDQLPRKFVDDDDSGLQMITWPRGGRPEPEHTMLYADEVMSGFEYSAAAAMVQAGLVREGFKVVRAVYDRYDGRLRTGLSEAAWGYSGNPFCDDECGKFYARAMSVWSMLLACQGFVYDGPAGVLGFRPVWRPEDHRSFFTTARGWGLFSQRREDGEQRIRIEVRHGEVTLNKLLLDLPNGLRPSRVDVRLDSKALDSCFTVIRRDLEIMLAIETTLTAGQVLEVTLS